MVDVTISLVGSNGDTIVLEDDGDYVLATGVQGFGIPATSVRIEDSAGNGGTWRNTKRGVRYIDLPIVVFGDDRHDVEGKLRRLARLLQDTNGATRIVATYTNGEQVYLEAHYVGGAETQFGDDATATYCRWVIQMQAPQPFWQTSVEDTFSINTATSTGRGLLPQLTRLKLTSNTVYGVVSVNNQGDVEVQPRWVISGPVSGLTITDGTNSFGFTETIPDGEVWTVDTSTGKVYNNLGANKYGSLASAPKLFPLKTGITNVQVNGTDPNVRTSIKCYYPTRYEVIY